MGTLTANGVRLHFEEAGQGEETIVFSHSYLLDSEHFSPQIATLSERYRCIAYDHRGHGGSEAPGSAYGMEDLYADAEAFIEAAGCAPCHFVGLSTGGFIGLRLAIRRPDLLRSLVLMDTSADAEPRGRARQYRAMLWILSRIGYWPLRRRVAAMFFSPQFRADPKRRAEFRYWSARATANDRGAMVRFGRAILGRASVAGQLGHITVPTQIIVGEDDVPTPVAEARRMAEGIPGARLEVIPGAGHISTVDEPGRVTAVIEDFLGRLEQGTGRGLDSTAL